MGIRYLVDENWKKESEPDVEFNFESWMENIQLFLIAELIEIGLFDETSMYSS